MVKRRVRRSAVPDQYLGFSLQVNRLLWHLLRTEPGSAVSLEVLGDVAVRSPDGNVLVEEGKNRRSMANPVADHAVDLWKTLRNWLDSVSSGALDGGKAHFVLHTSRPFKGALVIAFHKASTMAEAREALNTARDALWGASPKFRKRAEVSEILRPHLDRLFASESRSCVEQIIERFTLRSGSALSQSELVEALKAKAIESEVLEDVLSYLLGWVKRQTDEMISQGKQAWIHEEDFRKEIIAFVRKIACRRMLASFAPPPGDAAVRQHLATRRYVRQLQVIESSEDDQLAAVADYLKTETDRIEWAEKGFVHTSTLDEVEETLVRAWENLSTIVGIESPNLGELERGRLLLARCSMHRVSVEGLEPPGHFTPGSYHALSDELIVGWHPRFSELLESEDRGIR